MGKIWTHPKFGCLLMAIIIAALIIYGLGWLYAFHHEIMRHRARWLYEINHERLASAVKSFAWSTNYYLSVERDETFMPGDTNVPQLVWDLQPSSVHIDQEKVRIGCASAWAPFALFIYKTGVKGSGTVEIADGIWFWAEDERIPVKK